MSEEPADDEPTQEPADEPGADGSGGADGDSDDFTFPVEDSTGSETDDTDRAVDGRERAADESERTADDPDHATGPEGTANDAASDDGEASSSSDDHVGETPADATVDLSERWSPDPAERDAADPFANDSADVSSDPAEDATAAGDGNATDDGAATDDGDAADDATADDATADDDGTAAEDGSAADAGHDESDGGAGTDGTDAGAGTDEDEESPYKVNYGTVGTAGTPDDPYGETVDPPPEADSDRQGGGADASDGAPDPPYDHTGSTTEGGSAGPNDVDDARGTAASDGAGATAGDGGTATGTGGTTAGTGGSTLGGHVSTPPDDEELPLTEHIEEMLSRLGIVVVVATLATLAVVPFSGDLIGQIWYDVHPGSYAQCLHAPRPDSCTPPHVYGPFEFVLMRIRVAGLAGILVALPLVVYQTYRFMRPGLYPKERRYYLASVPFSLVLGAVGMLFSYFVILPLLFEYFITYTEGSATPAFALSDTMSLVLVMLGMTAVIFQIPLFIMLAIMMGLVTREWLEGRRIYFWGLFLGVAFLFGPDPTGMAPVLLTGTMIVLFEATLLLLRWTGR